jgi:phosphoserine phosphatase RsbU/P
VPLYAGDTVLLFTDGVSEMKNPHNAMFGEPALEALLLQYMNERSQRRLDAIINHLSDFTEGHPLEDDLSVVLMEVH